MTTTRRTTRGSRRLCGLVVALLVVAAAAGIAVPIPGVAPVPAYGCDHTSTEQDPCVTAAAAPAPATLLTIPAADGWVNVDPILAALPRAVGLRPPPATGWSFDLKPILAAIGLFELGQATENLLSLGVDTRGVSLRYDGSALASVWGRFTSALDHLSTEGVSKAAMLPVWTLTFLHGDKAEAGPAPARGEAPRHAVVLVHGLDEPGWIWDDLGPALCNAGHSVYTFEYPNDGPIAESTDCLGEALRTLRATGVEQVDLVAHSMGGLLVRDVLTRDHWYDGSGRATRRLPKVTHAILIGTPNHGAPVAMLQPVSEIKDQVVRLFRGQARLNAHVDDGAGEASRDLQPDSPFLAELNRRPLPEGVEFTVIAGCLAPRTGIADGFDRLLHKTGAEPNPLGNSVLGARERIRCWMGDGLVTLDSTALEGVDDVVIVTGNHQSILKRWMTKKTPPAVGVVVDRLGRKG